MDLKAQYRISQACLRNQELLPYEEARRIFQYDPATGILYWRVRMPHGRGGAGDIAGTLNGNGYLHVKVRRIIYSVHRVVWLWNTGTWPEDQLDHISGDRTDNTFRNLRSADRFINNRNKKLSILNTSGVPGVRWRKDRRRWTAEIRIGGPKIHLGTFVDKFEAICARKSTEYKNGYHINHGRDAL